MDFYSKGSNKNTNFLDIRSSSFFDTSRLSVKHVFFLVAIFTGFFCYIDASFIKSYKDLQNYGNVAYIEEMDDFHKKIYHRRASDPVANIKFRTNTGAVIVKEQFYTDEILEDFQTGKPVKIFYDPKDPQNKAIFEKVVQSPKLSYKKAYQYFFITLVLVVMAFSPKMR